MGITQNGLRVGPVTLRQIGEAYCSVSGRGSATILRQPKPGVVEIITATSTTISFDPNTQTHILGKYSMKSISQAENRGAYWQYVRQIPKHMRAAQDG